MNNKGNTTLIVVIIVLVVIGLALYNSNKGKYVSLRQGTIDNFVECASYGYPVTASYPRQCMTPDGKVFTESALTATAYTSQGGSTTVYQPYGTPSQGSGSLAYVRYPIASSTATSGSSSRYIVPVDSYSSASRTSYYYNSGYSNSGGCYVGGCSSQICSGEPGAISTCEYRPEYACYQSAGRCERQANGQCGWTMTRELSLCLSGAY